jgi:uncharacterized membrane protein
METIEEEMKRLEEENKPLETENKELAKKVRELEDGSFVSSETVGFFQAKLRTTKENYHRLKDLVERQEQEIKTIQPQLRKALEQSEKEKSLLEYEVEELHQEIGNLKENIKQKQIQRKNALDNLTPKERDVYNYILRHKGTVNIAQLMKITGYTAQDIFKIFDGLKSKNLIC